MASHMSYILLMMPQPEIIRAYKDGVLSATVSQTSGNITGGTGLTVGNYGTSGQLVAGAKMDEVRIYNRAVSAAEIAQTWNKELPLFKVPNDAGMSSVIEPSDTCTGQYDVKAEVQNYGTNVINNVQINWSYNGIIQTPITYSNPLDTANGVGPNKATITLGQLL